VGWEQCVAQECAAVSHAVQQSAATLGQPPQPTVVAVQNSCVCALRLLLVGLGPCFGHGLCLKDATHKGCVCTDVVAAAWKAADRAAVLMRGLLLLFAA
jgi:hypothetical protein